MICNDCGGEVKRDGEGHRHFCRYWGEQLSEEIILDTFNISG